MTSKGKEETFEELSPSAIKSILKTQKNLFSVATYQNNESTIVFKRKDFHPVKFKITEQDPDDKGWFW